MKIEDPLSCWPKPIRRDGLFRELYEIHNFSNKIIPFELYPFLYLPYDAETIWQRVEERDILVNPDPNDISPENEKPPDLAASSA